MARRHATALVQARCQIPAIGMFGHLVRTATLPRLWEVGLRPASSPGKEVERMGPIGILPQEPVNIWQFESPSPTYMTEDGEHAIIAKPENAEAEHFYRRAIVVSTAYRRVASTVAR